MKHYHTSAFFIPSPGTVSAPSLISTPPLSSHNDSRRRLHLVLANLITFGIGLLVSGLSVKDLQLGHALSIADLVLAKTLLGDIVGHSEMLRQMISTIGSVPLT
ncbi:hypothetical protein OQA88_5010 [Cercophora sp. LCS_1]